MGRIRNYLCLELGRQLGANVRRVTRGADSDSATRRRNAARALVEGDGLRATIRIPNAAGDVEITADLPKRQLRTSLSLGAPGTGRPRTRVNWLIRQLASAPDTLRVDARFAGRRQTTSNLLSALREDPTLALLDSQAEPRVFEIMAVNDLAVGRRSGRSSFIESTRATVQDFYELVVQDLRPWTPAAPRLAAPEEAEPSQNALSPLQKWLKSVAAGTAGTN